MRFTNNVLWMWNVYFILFYKFCEKCFFFAINILRIGLDRVVISYEVFIRCCSNLSKNLNVVANFTETAPCRISWKSFHQFFSSYRKRSDTAKLIIFETLCYGRSKGRNKNKREEEQEEEKWRNIKFIVIKMNRWRRLKGMKAEKLKNKKQQRW
jgi:hypothetical protein